MMVRTFCRTNLDIKHYNEKWPRFLPARPMVGDIIRSETKWKREDSEGGFIHQLELQVCRITWHNSSEDDSWICEVELTLIPTRFVSISEFNKWYDKITR